MNPGHRRHMCDCFWIFRPQSSFTLTTQNTKHKTQTHNMVRPDKYATQFNGEQMNAIVTEANKYHKDKVAKAIAFAQRRWGRAPKPTTLQRWIEVFRERRSCAKQKRGNFPKNLKSHFTKTLSSHENCSQLLFPDTIIITESRLRTHFSN